MYRVRVRDLSRIVGKPLVGFRRDVYSSCYLNSIDPCGRPLGNYKTFPHEH